MKNEIREICGYLRDVLNFRDFIEIPDDKDTFLSISYSEILSGRLEYGEDRKALLAQWRNEKDKGGARGDRKRKDSEQTDDDNTVDIVLIPKTVSDMVPRYDSPSARNRLRPWEYKTVSLMYIKARCDPETLTLSAIEGESIIWADPVIREGSPNPLVRLLNRWLRKYRGREGAHTARFELRPAPAIYLADCGDWHKFISGVADHFKRRTGLDFFNSAYMSDTTGTPHCLHNADMEGDIAVMKDDTVFATHHIVRLLSHIESAEADLPLLESMLLGRCRGDRPLCSGMCGTDIPAHLGQMKNEFPLADAQRDVVHCMSRLKSGEVLAVSGPPGTGKTTMLQSIVADLLVRMTLENRNSTRSPTSPLIIAASANNKAITNIIDAFSVTDQDTSKTGIHCRWLTYTSDDTERFVPMAVYMPSGSVRRNVTKKYFVTDYSGGGDYGQLRRAYIADTDDFYVRANKALGTEYEDIDDIMADISARMTRCSDDIYAVGRTADRGGDLSAARSADRRLDLTVRYDLYWLAVHYNECVWIKKIEAARNDPKKSKVYGKFLYDEMRYICPCLVSTFFRMPALFEFRRKDKSRDYNFGMADLLIVDEAGQVSPEIGLPTFAFADKAIVVGDVMQIPPVYGVPANSVSEYWGKNVRSAGLQDREELLSCCRSSVMAIAGKSCRWRRAAPDGETKDGLFLDEHRRCVDEIIDYSNRLIYDGELTPKRGAHRDICVMKELPPMGIYVTESRSETKAGGRVNPGEVEAIREWIESNRERILRAYNRNADRPKKITDLINIITPFKAQARIIREDSCLGRFPSGTVHTFQGAESPVVIFSPVYGRNDNPVFIKNNHELMNVAVSRAKDHFIVIGSRECLENNREDEACRLLYEKAEIIPLDSHIST